jgi:hypothetical protein
VNFGSGIAGNGTYVTLNYRVRYAKAEGMESILVWKAEGGKPEIVGHHFESPALLDESLRPAAPAEKGAPAGA